MSEAFDADYSQIADRRFDQIESSGDAALYNAVLDVCELIFSDSDLARRSSTAINTDDGIRMVLAVRGYRPYKVFWSLDGPRVEAVFPYDQRWQLPAP